MALTPEKRKALMLARKRIAIGNSNYICLSLQYVWRRYPHLSKATKELTGYISDKLGGRGVSLEEWQRRNGFPARSLAQLRRDRLAWIDWMLDEPKEA